MGRCGARRAWRAFGKPARVEIARYRIAVQTQFACNCDSRPALPGELDDLLIAEVAAGLALVTETLASTGCGGGEKATLHTSGRAGLPRSAAG